MPEEKQQPISEEAKFISKLQEERKVGLDYQKRRHEQWSETYTLYRDTVELNRLTQRQAVNIPLMKETIKTLLAEIDEAPDIIFETLEENLEIGLTKEYVLNEYWVWNMEQLDFEGMDIQDKKSTLLYGRSFIKLNFLDGMFEAEVLDVYDILVDPKTNPLKIDSARYLIHQNIYKPLKSILANDKYDKKAKDKLKTYLSGERGLILGGQNRENLEDKKERMQTMGGEDFANIEQLLSGAEIIVSLAEHYTTEWDEKKKEFYRCVAVVAEDNIVLYKKSMDDALGVDFWPLTTWAEDIEVSDFWSDGEGDVVRVINKVLNAWFSQAVENRTYRNFGMYFYDAANTKGFNPKSFTPEPWGFYPVPGKPSEFLEHIKPEGLSESMAEMDFLIRLGEKATATPATGKGIVEKRQTTFGEIEAALSQAKERVKGSAKFYRRSRKEFAKKWYAIIDANVVESSTTILFKKAYDGTAFSKKVKASDWKSKAGYRVKVTSSSEQDAETSQSINKLVAIKNQFPNNPVLARIIQKRLLEVGDLNPEEIKEVAEFEKKSAEMIQAPPQVPPAAPAPSAPMPNTGLKTKVGELKKLAGATV